MPGPWRARDRRTFASTTALGLAGLLIGYWGASETVAQSTQLRWTALAVTGVAVAGLGNAVWLAGAARDVRARRAQLITAMVAVKAAPAEHVEAVGHEPVVSADGMTYYHRSDCLMVAGKTVKEGTSGKQPCPICGPG